MKQRWHILGAGSIGCLWACHLTESGYPVSLILRNQQRLTQFSEKSGIQIGNDFFAVSAELADGPLPIQQLLVTTKAIDTIDAFNSIRERVADNARVVVLQNGMGSQQWIKAQLPNADVTWASTTDGAWLKSPFSLVHAGKGFTRIGSPDTNYPWLMSLDNGFLNVEIDDDISGTLWRKLAINCAINPLTAVHQCKNGDLIKNPDYLATMAAICREVELVAEAEGLRLFEGPLIEQACQVAELTADNFSSMLQDIRHQRTTEISHITGYLCDLAKQHHLRIPTNQLYLRKIEKIQDDIKLNQAF
ncbi:MAG: 2-dehydropantoate 2-reductase [Oceanospirillaceae bacterium]|nr:2-dehydropantoate 2-reductase [Oceanospirillaceae bacterium]